MADQTATAGSEAMDSEGTAGEGTGNEGTVGPAASPRVFGVLGLAFFSFVFIANINTVAPMATYGWSSLTFYAIAIGLLLIPTALASAELGSSLPRTGGIFVWTREALGERWGFLVIWLEWAAPVIAMPSITTLMATQVAYGFDPNLANNKTFMFAIILVTIWVMTFFSLRGLRVAAGFNKVAVIGGNLVPAVVVVAFAIYWLSKGNSSQLAGSSVVPSFKDFGNIVFASTAFLMFAGIEISAIHAGSVKDPARTIPKANAITAVLCVLLFVPVTLAVAAVVPSASISPLAGLMEALRSFFDDYDLDWLIPIFGILVASGLAIGLLQLLGGPARGLVVAARDGNLPKWFHRENRHAMPGRIILVQASISSVLAMVYLLLPSVQNAWWVLAAVQTQITLLIYILMYASVLRLRRKRPDLLRPFKIPGGAVGPWVVCGAGILSCLAVIGISYVPPDQLDSMPPIAYAACMLAGVLIVGAIPLVLRAVRKPEWKEPDILSEADA